MTGTVALADAPRPLRIALGLAVGVAVVAPFLDLLAGQVDLQAGRTPAAYLTRTVLIAAAWALVNALLFLAAATRLRWPGYVHGVLVVLYVLGALKATVDLAFDLSGSARTLAGTGTIVGVVPPAIADGAALLAHTAVLYLLLQPDVLAHVHDRARTQDA